MRLLDLVLSRLIPPSFPHPFFPALPGVEFDEDAMRFFRTSKMSPTQHLMNMMGHNAGEKVGKEQLKKMHRCRAFHHLSLSLAAPRPRPRPHPRPREPSNVRTLPRS